MKFLIILHLTIICQAQEANRRHLNMKLNRLTRVTDGLQKDVSDIWTIITTSGIENVEFGNKTKTDTNNINQKETCAMGDGKDTMSDVKELKTEVKQLMMYSKIGFKNEKEFQREAISDLNSSWSAFQNGLAEEIPNIKHNVDKLDTQVSGLQESSKNLQEISKTLRETSKNLQETSKSNQLRIETTYSHLNERVNENVDEIESHGILLENMKTMIETLDAKQINLEMENQKLKQTISDMQEKSTKLQIKTLCDENWTHYNGHCYLFKSEKETWSTALNSCRSKNSYLVEITSEPEMKFVARLASSGAFWIGATDIQEGYEGTYVYQESKLTPPEKFWNEGEPNNYNGKEHCAEMQKEDLKLNDYPCYWPVSFVCEKAATPITQ